MRKSIYKIDQGRECPYILNNNMRAIDRLPAAVVYKNNWSRLTIPSTFVPTELVSIIVPYYQDKNKLSLVLEGLRHQTYPSNLTEIIIVDDGSDPPLVYEGGSTNIRIIRQARNGFGAARARNNGARCANGTILIFVDGDMILSKDNIMSHAKWHHSFNNLYTTISDLRYTDNSNLDINVNDLDNAPHLQMQYLLDYLHKSNNLTDTDDDLFSLLPGPNFGIRKEQYWKIGGNFEGFQHWGLEDTYLTYRAYICGLVIIPILDAYGLHLGIPTNKEYSLNAALLEDLVPHESFRKPYQKRIFAIPKYVVSVISNNRDVILSIVFDLLNDPPYDCMIYVYTNQLNHNDALYVQRRLEHDPRICLDSLDTILDVHPYSSFYISIDSNHSLQNKLITKLLHLMNINSHLTVIDDKCKITIIRTWLYHRMRESDEYILLNNKVIYKSLYKKRKADTRPPIEIRRPMRLVRIIKNAISIFRNQGIYGINAWLYTRIKYYLFHHLFQ